MDPDEIRRLETIADRAWPARESETGPGWECRFSDGMHRRLNSASVWEAGDLSAAVDSIEAWFDERGQSPIFKLTEAAAPGLDDFLADRGYLPDARVAIMTARLAADIPGDPDSGVEIASGVSADWIDAFATMSEYGEDRRRLLEAVISRTRLPAVYALVRVSGAVVAVGMTVAEDAHAGIFEMITHADHRSQGHAAAVLDGLLSWMGQSEVEIAYLQVLQGNQPAERLYMAAGFTSRYHYWYRVRPDWLSTTPR